MTRLLIVEGPLKGKSFEITGGSTLGRSHDATVRVEGRHISRVHCTFEARGENLVIIDNDSRNGIFVNGHKVKEQLLAKDDEIEVGEHIFIFEPTGDPIAERAAKAPPPLPPLPEDLVKSGDVSAESPTAVGTASTRRGAAMTVVDSLADPFSESALKASVHRLQSFVETLRILNGSDDDRQITKALLERLVAETKASRGFIMLSDDRGKMAPAARVAPPGEDEFYLSNVLYHQVSRERKAILAIDKAKKGPHQGKPVSLLVAPLIVRNSFLGFIYLEAPPLEGLKSAFSTSDLGHISGISSFAAVTLAHLRKIGRITKAIDLARRRMEQQYKLIGDGPPMLQASGHLEAVAPTNATVLVIGESGTGKELVARAMHARSDRASGPFISVNCAALEPGLVESELFGHEKGAFTGANEAKVGLFEAAHTGTVFLNEVGRLTPEIQARLLKVVETQRFTRIGGKEEILVDVRIIAASSQDLEREMKEGRFRQELYWKLAVVVIKLPPLRDRREDIPKLVRHLLEQEGGRIGGALEDHVAPDVLGLLNAHDWPGNVAELRVAMERMLMKAGTSRIMMEHVPADLVVVMKKPDAGA